MLFQGPPARNIKVHGLDIPVEVAASAIQALATIISAILIGIGGGFITYAYNRKKTKQDREAQWRDHAVELTKLELERKSRILVGNRKSRPTILDFLANYRDLQELGSHNPKELYQKIRNERITDVSNVAEESQHGGMPLRWKATLDQCVSAVSQSALIPAAACVRSSFRELLAEGHAPAVKNIPDGLKWLADNGKIPQYLHPAALSISVLSENWGTSESTPSEEVDRAIDLFRECVHILYEAPAQLQAAIGSAPLPAAEQSLRQHASDTLEASELEADDKVLWSSHPEQQAGPADPGDVLEVEGGEEGH